MIMHESCMPQPLVTVDAEPNTFVAPQLTMSSFNPPFPSLSCHFSILFPLWSLLPFLLPLYVLPSLFLPPPLSARSLLNPLPFRLAPCSTPSPNRMPGTTCSSCGPPSRAAGLAILCHTTTTRTTQWHSRLCRNTGRPWYR